MCGVLAGFHAVEISYESDACTILLVSLHKKCADWDLKVKEQDTPPRKLNIDTQSWAIFESFDTFSKTHHFLVNISMSRFEVIYLPCQKTTSWKPCWTFNRCSTRQSAPLGFRRLCRTAAGQLEQRREMQQRRRAECEADGEGWGWMGKICLEEDVFFDDSLWMVWDWYLFDGFEYLVFSCLFLSLCWLVLKSCLFRFDFLVYIIWRNFERLGRWAQQQQNIRESSNITPADRHSLVPNIFQ